LEKQRKNAKLYSVNHHFPFFIFRFSLLFIIFAEDNLRLGKHEQVLSALSLHYLCSRTKNQNNK
jgi:hypothetical protein